jgi:hypothetical protein
MKTLTVLSAMLAMLFSAAAAQAVQFSYLDPGYAQEIYAGPLLPNQEAGMAWTTGGNLLTRAGSTIVEYSLTQNASSQPSPPPATPVHGVIATHPIPGLLTGVGMTNGLDGYIYAATASGLQRFSPVTWTMPAPGILPNSQPAGFGWGITTLPDGRIAYSDSSNVYLYNPSTFTNQLIYTASVQIDDMEAGPGGQIALAGHSSPGSIVIISSSGSLINSFSALGNHFPDGLAFGDGLSSNMLFSNNNNGSISKYVFPLPGYLGTPTITDIATNIGSGAYGDLAAVGPDCAFYVTQYENGGSNGSTPGVGTHWDNGVTTADASIVRISAVASDGTPICGFYSSTETVPEPDSLLLSLAGIGVLSLRARWVRAVLFRRRQT